MTEYEPQSTADLIDVTHPGINDPYGMPGASRSGKPVEATPEAKELSEALDATLGKTEPAPEPPKHTKK